MAFWKTIKETWDDGPYSGVCYSVPTGVAWEVYHKDSLLGRGVVGSFCGARAEVMTKVSHHIELR